MRLPPRPERRMCGRAARVVRNAPSRWMASIFFHSAYGTSSSGCTIWMPALLTSTSTPPQALTTSSTAALTCASLVTSMATPSAVPPRRRISSAAACAASLLRSAIATLAPSRAKREAISLPMPLAAPVTMQIRSGSFMGRHSFHGLACGYGRGPLRIDEVEDAHAVVFGRSAPGPARVVQGLQDVCLAGGPVLAHGEPRKFVVLGVVLVLLRPIDEVDDVEAHAR